MSRGIFQPGGGVRRPTENDALGRIERPARKAKPKPRRRNERPAEPPPEPRPGLPLWAEMIHPAVKSDCYETLYYHNGIDTEGRRLIYERRVPRAWRDIPPSPHPIDLAEQKLRPEWWEYCASDDELQPKGWKPDDDNWHPPEAQHELPRHQCCCCGKGLRGTDWLCRDCKTLIGVQYNDELARNIGVTPDTLYKAPWPVLTPKGKLATPDELNTGDLEYFQFAVWPKEVKLWKRDEKIHRENYTPTRYSWSYDKMLEDGQEASDSYSLALAEGEEGQYLIAALFGRADDGLMDAPAPAALPELPEDRAAFLRGGLEEPDPQADLTTGDYVIQGDEVAVALRHAIVQLTPQQQEHVYMWLRGRTQAEIAEAQGYKRQATVSAHRAKIKETLRALILAELGNSRENS